jgi:hypothetical protein
LNGFASSADGKLVALAKTNEAVVAGFPSGLGLFRADNGEAVVADAAFTGRVLGFSRNGSRLFTQVGDAVVVLGTADLREVGRFSWPAGTAFLGVSPGGWLVGAGAGVTSWWDPSSGKIVRQAPYALEPLSLSWSADGRLGVGLGGGALVHLWREADGAELCAPAPSGAAAPPLSSLGDTSYAAPGAAVAPGQPVVAVNRAVVHTHSSDWTAVHVLDAATGAELRVFGAAPQPRAIAIGDGGGRLFTEEGPDVAVWCR